jgi:hypothetical protein
VALELSEAKAWLTNNDVSPTKIPIIEALIFTRPDSFCVIYF